MRTLSFPTCPRAKSLNDTKTHHDGVFVVRSAHVEAYQTRFAAQLLRLNRTFRRDLAAENFGMVKGLGYERVLIVPYSGIAKWLTTGISTHVANSADEVYVGITRAYQSVAFIHDGDVAVPGISVFEP